MNLNRILSFLKHTLLIAVVLTTVGISGCDNGDDGPTTFNGTIMDLIQDAQFHQTDALSIDQSDKSLDSLVKYLKIYPDLTTLLSGTDNYTLFAPSNTAFKSLIALPGFPPDIRKINPALIKSVLSYHIVSGITMKSAITSGASFSTLYTGAANNPDDKISVNADGTLLTGSSNNAIKITTSDKKAKNGVVHVTGTVLIPQTIGASLTPVLGTIAGTVLLGADFTYLAKLIANADAGVSADQRIATLLAKPNPNAVPADASSTVRRTFFAPPNAVFLAAGGGTEAGANSFITALGTGSTSAARAILLNHLITSDSKKYYVISDVAGTTDDIVIANNATAVSNAGKTLTFMTGTTITANNPYGVVVVSPSNPVSQAPIVSKDISCANGVLQVVAGILKPQ